MTIDTVRYDPHRLSRGNTPASSNEVIGAPAAQSIAGKSKWAITGNAIKNFFYQSSIFQASSPRAVESLKNENQPSDLWKEIKLGCYFGAGDFARGVIVTSALGLLALGIESISKGKLGVEATTEDVTLLEGAASAIAEEVLFRGLLQNGVWLLQKSASRLVPQCIRNSHFFKWLTSPSPRILAVNILFAGVHLFNAGDYLSTKGAVIQATRIMLYPSHSLEYEITGSLVVPMMSHLTNNVISTLIDR